MSSRKGWNLNFPVHGEARDLRLHCGNLDRRNEGKQMNGLLVRILPIFIPLKTQRFASARFYDNRSWVSCDVHLKDSHDFTYLLKKYGSIKHLKEIHAQMIVGGHDQNRFLASKLVGKYNGLGSSSMDSAKKLFDYLLDRDVFSWNMIVQGYANFGPYEKAIDSFNEMRKSGFTANVYTYTSVLKACGAARLSIGEVIHAEAVKCGVDANNVFVGNALITFYSKCSLIESSKRVFLEMPERDIISWNSIISGCVLNGLCNEALELFHSMLRDNAAVGPNRATLVSILPACAQESAIRECLSIHSHIMKSGMELDPALASGLISAYANCGRLHKARLVFDQTCNKNIVVWHAMIRGYGMHGHAGEALKLFRLLEETGLQPDSLIFSSVLAACSHAGMVTLGIEIFEKMEGYGIEKEEGHYACLVDIFGRSGLIEEALKLIKAMPVEAGKDVLGSLLGACRMHNKIELAEQVAEKLFVLDPENAGRYMIMAKMYKDYGRLEDSARLRKVLRDKKIRRPAGYSAIDVNNVFHHFEVEDESHPLKEEIFDTLEKLNVVVEDERDMVDQADNPLVMGN